jgi:hypothetical protein
MANKYHFDVPYYCTTYGHVSGYVIANDSDEAEDKIHDKEFENEEYSDNDSDSYNFDCENGSITVEEYDIYYDENDEDDESEYYGTVSDKNKIPVYYLSEILLI